MNSEETGSHYVSIQTMTAYEVKENLIKYKARDSTTGSRNLLRLQRALEYIIAFMVKVPGIHASCFIRATVKKESSRPQK